MACVECVEDAARTSSKSDLFTTALRIFFSRFAGANRGLQQRQQLHSRQGPVPGASAAGEGLPAEKWLYEAWLWRRLSQRALLEMSGDERGHCMGWWHIVV